MSAPTHAPRTEDRRESPVVVAAAPIVSPVALGGQLDSIRQGSVDVVFATIASVESTETAIANIARWLRCASAVDSPIALVRTMPELDTVLSSNLVGIVLQLQGSDVLRGSLELLDVFALLGVRVMQPTYNYRTAAGDGCCEPDDAGLSLFGSRLVEALEGSGIAVDVSHAGERTLSDVIACSSKPVIASHSNARALCEHPRNLSDQAIRLIAETGGVIGLCAFAAFVSSSARPNLGALLDHAVYIADLVGPEHVGLGFDFADETEAEFDFYGYDERLYPRPPWIWPEGISGFGDVSNVAPALRARGFSDQEVAGVMGGNFLAALGKSWGEAEAP